MPYISKVCELGAIDQLEKYRIDVEAFKKWIKQSSLLLGVAGGPMGFVTSLDFVLQWSFSKLQAI